MHAEILVLKLMYKSNIRWYLHDSRTHIQLSESTVRNSHNMLNVITTITLTE